MIKKQTILMKIYMSETQTSRTSNQALKIDSLLYRPDYKATGVPLCIARPEVAGNITSKITGTFFIRKLSDNAGKYQEEPKK